MDEANYISNTVPNAADGASHMIKQVCNAALVIGNGQSQNLKQIGAFCYHFCLKHMPNLS